MTTSLFTPAYVAPVPREAAAIRYRSIHDCALRVRRRNCAVEGWI